MKQRVSRPQRAILIVLLAGQLAVRLAIIAHCGPLTDQGLYGDDSYICHKIARNIAEGAGITQAGEPTNGFQPLFVFLLVPVFWFLDVYRATVASAVLNSILSVASGYLLFIILRRLGGVRRGLVGLGLWTLSEYFVRVCLNGMETSLANFMLLAVLLSHLRLLDHAGETGSLRSIGQGALMGSALLARLDLGLLLLPLGADHIRVRLLRREYAQLAMVMTAGLLTIAPWFAWSRLVCGRWTPVSGEASRIMSQCYGDASGPQRDPPQYFPIGQIPGRFYANNVAAAGVVVLNDCPLAMLARRLTNRDAVAAALLLVGWLGIAYSVKPGDRSNASAGLRAWRVMKPLWFVWVFAMLLVTSYCFYFFAQWHFWRYFSPVVILSLIPAALAVERVMQWAWQRSVWRRLLLGMTFLAYLLVAVADHAAFFREPDPAGIAYRIYRDAEYLRDAATPDMRIGSFETGTLDYFVSARIINLDGKTNARAVTALRDACMGELIRELQLDYVVSAPIQIRDLLAQRSRGGLEGLEYMGHFYHNLVFRVGSGGVPPEEDSLMGRFLTTGPPPR